MTVLTTDRFLDGRIAVRQFADGFRAGLDAVMLAAAIPARTEDEGLELGGGCGCSIAGLEIDPELVALANENSAQNGFGARIRFVAGDVFDLPRELRRDFAHVFCNPPFHGESGQASPMESRDRALRDIGGHLGDWIEAGLKRTASGGTFTIILRADRMSEALARLPERGVTIFPLWPRAGEPAKRVILQAHKGSRAESVLAPGLVLHQADGSYTGAADAVLRGAALSIGSSTNL